MLFSFDREYLVDLFGAPGQLSDPDSFVNGPYSLSVPSPLRPPKFRSLEITSNFSSVAKQYFSDCHSLNLLFSDASTGYICETCCHFIPHVSAGLHYV